MLCSGRPENSIELAFAKKSTLRVQDFNSGDIKKFVIGRFGAITSNLTPQEDFDEISDLLRLKAFSSGSSS